MENFKFQISNFKFITQEPIRLEKVLRTSIPLSCGAMVLFIGIVRNHDEGKSVQKLFYECYPEMAEKEIHSIIEQAQKNFSVEDVRVVHRIGWLEVGELALVIMVSSAHRPEAFSACRAILEEIKKTVPIWKKEVYMDGTSEWVSPCQL
ncbi:MAG: molybdenum cofactor biosynthesis protein MoaE [Chlamydiae bacterium]|nr:molybdenum cofactor biosynthesis protein MoaE [Chlamydiota bacterium]